MALPVCVCVCLQFFLFLWKRVCLFCASVEKLATAFFSIPQNVSAITQISYCNSMFMPLLCPLLSSTHHLLYSSIFFNNTILRYLSNGAKMLKIFNLIGDLTEKILFCFNFDKWCELCVLFLKSCFYAKYPFVLNKTSLLWQYN